MIQISIKKQGVITNQAKFKTQAEADAWLAQEESNQSFGKLNRWAREDKNSEATQTREVTDIDGTHTEYFIPKKYVVVVEDVTLDEDARAAKQVDRQNKYQTRIDALKVLDWTTVPAGPVKQILKVLVEDFLKDQ